MTSRPAHIGQVVADQSPEAPIIIHVRSLLRTPSQDNQQWALVIQLLGRPSFLTLLPIDDLDDGQEVLITLQNSLLQISKAHTCRKWFSRFCTTIVVGTANIVRVGEFQCLLLGPKEAGLAECRPHSFV